MLRLDYVSCLLTVLSTLFVARRQWYGLLIGALNCIIISVIGYHTHQYGFIAANLFCLVAYIASVRSWRRGSTRPIAAPTGAPGKLFLVPRSAPLTPAANPLPQSSAR